jgi:hypothetical protein
MSEETTNEAPVSTETESTGAELTVQDLASLKQIIDVASQRGAFKPNEMTVVGQTYGKLESFLGEIQKQQASATADQGA